MPMICSCAVHVHRLPVYAMYASYYLIGPAKGQGVGGRWLGLPGCKGHRQGARDTTLGMAPHVCMSYGYALLQNVLSKGGVVEAMGR